MCNCICTALVPENSEKCFVLRPSCLFVQGTAYNYVGEYDENILASHLTRKTFEKFKDEINDIAGTRWPCPGCLCIGYCFSICTLGLSLCLPFI